MEDAVDMREDIAGFRLFVVYDGHAEQEAVSVVKQILPNILASHLQDEADVETGICKAFGAVDAEVAKSLVEKEIKESDLKVSSGTVACIALVRGKELWVANLGDCRAVLCKEGTKAHTISVDH
ncbi:PPM1L [Symbiodinium pilosum]|uniref:PPM1L protein n=1 Tax=Symbiodinium pilosum TaxID=2952 RepID=A0A812JRP0_SYMPI|nr:PPM1L [Symbiodinium pilosum]